MKIEYSVNASSEKEVLEHLSICDSAFASQLSSRVDLAEYAKKIFEKAETIEAWSDRKLVGLLAVYFNEACGYITNVSVVPELAGKGIGTRLMTDCVSLADSQGIKTLELEVDGNDDRAREFYANFEFALVKKGERFLMSRVLPRRKG